MVMNLQTPQNAGNSLSRWETMRSQAGLCYIELFSYITANYLRRSYRKS